MLGHRAHDGLAKTRAACPDVPISTVGCALATTSASPIRLGASSAQCGDPIAALRERRLERLQVGHALDQEALAVDQIKTAARLRFAQAGFDHGAQQQGANAGAGRAARRARRCVARLSGTPVTLIALNSVPTAIAAVP